MTPHANELLAAALKKVDLNGGFSPAQVGARLGLTRPQAEAAARDLANAGVLVLGFDCDAEFSPDYRKAHAPAKSAKKKSGARLGRA